MNRIGGDERNAVVTRGKDGYGLGCYTKKCRSRPRLPLCPAAPVAGCENRAACSNDHVRVAYDHDRQEIG